MSKKLFCLLVPLIIFLGLLYFGWLVWGYYKQIKSGDLIVAENGQFTLLVNSPIESVKKFDQTLIKGEDSQQIGNPAAKIQIVEFIDFTCSFSKQAFLVMRELVAKYPERVGLTIRHFPLQDDSHQGGLEAAIASVCAAEQGKFWAYHDRLFQNQKKFTQVDLQSYAGQIGLNVPSFIKCLGSEEARKKVENDWADGYSLGIVGTPTFFVNNQKIEGSVPLSAWEQVINK